MRGLGHESDDTTVQRLQRKQHMVGMGILFLATIIALAFLLKVMTNPTPQPQTAFTVTGTAVCLPHKDTSGPTTLECAFGLQGDDGRYYAIAPADRAAQLEVGKTLRVTGTLTPPKSNEIYNIAGTIQATDVQEE